MNKELSNADCMPKRDWKIHRKPKPNYDICRNYKVIRTKWGFFVLNKYLKY